MNYQYNTIEEALDDLRKGKIILVTDDEDRENEGDMIYVMSCQRSYLYSYERRDGSKTWTATDGIRKH